MKKFSKFNFFISFLLLFFVVGFITNTPDWAMYEYFFNKVEQNREPMFYFLKLIIKSYNGNFENLHMLNTFLTSLFLILFISRFTKNIFLVLLLFLPSVFVFYTSQIRYYLAFSIIINSFYYFEIKQKRTLGLILFLISFLSHYSMLLFLPFYYFLRYSKKSHIKLIVYSYTGLLLFLILKTALAKIYHLDFYFRDDNETSFIGALFNFLPYVFIITVNYFLHFKNTYKRRLDYDDKLNFLYKLSFLPILYLPIAFEFQVVGRRIIFPSFLFSILYIIYLSNFYNKKIKIKLMVYLTFISSFIFIYGHYVPFLIWSKSTRLDNLILILTSNKFLF